MYSIYDLHDLEHCRKASLKYIKSIALSYQSVHIKQYPLEKYFRLYDT